MPSPHAVPSRAPRSVRTRRSALRRGLVGALALSLGLGAGVVTPSPAAAVVDLPGDGTARDPHRIASAEDLLAVAEAVNTDPAAHAGLAYALTADIDFGGAEFPGLNTFRGQLDGGGHTIHDLVLGSHPDGGGDRGFVRTLDGGTIRGLTLDGVTADNGDGSGWIGGLAVRATDATLTGNAVIDADFAAPAGEKVAALAAELHGGSVTDNWVQADVLAHKMPAGAVSYARHTTDISRNLIEADLTVVSDGGAGTRGIDAGLVLAYPGNPNDGTFAANVALGGGIAYTGTVDGFVGRVIGYTGYDGWTAPDNRANAAITIDGETVTGPGEEKDQHGLDTDAAALADPQTYVDLGWDLTDAWAFDEDLGHPVPSASAGLVGDGSPEFPFEIGTPADLEFLRARLAADSPRYTGDKAFALTADLDFTDEPAFTGIDRFTGVLEGRGHRITGLRLAPGEGGGSLARDAALVRELDGAEVRDLTLDGVRATSATGSVAAVAVRSTDSVIERVSVPDLRLIGSRSRDAAGVVVVAGPGTVVSDSWVSGTLSGRERAAGIAARADGDARLERTLTSVDLTARLYGGSTGAFVGSVLAHPVSGSEVTLEANVAFEGSLTHSGGAHRYAGRVSGSDSATLADNRSAAEVTIQGRPVTGGKTTNRHGANASAEALGQRGTYEALGWDFAQDWEWDDELGHPVPQYLPPDAFPSRVVTTFHGDPATRRAFTWTSVLESGDAQVLLSTDADFPDSGLLEVDAQTETTDAGRPVHRAVATDLEPGTRYHYRVGDAGRDVWAETGTFVTAGEEDTEEFSFVALTDTQAQDPAGAELAAETIDKALTHVPDARFLAHAGDVVGDGTVDSQWRDLLDAAAPSLRSTTLLPAAGERDDATGGFAEHLTLDAPGSEDPQRGSSYSLTYGAAHVIVLDSTTDPDQGVSEAQLDWMRTDAAAAREAGAEWVVVLVHTSPYSTSDAADDPQVRALRSALMPLLDELDVDLVLAGNDHVMTRSKELVSDPDGTEGAAVVPSTTITEMRAGKRAEYLVDPEGTVVFVPNTAGSTRQDQLDTTDAFDLESYLNLFARTGPSATENFAGVTVTPDRLTVDVYDIKDRGAPRLFDSFGLDRQITPVDEVLAALPEADAVTVDDAEQVRDGRIAVDTLSTEQQTALAHLERLTDAETRLRELQGRVDVDGDVLAWAVPDAESRQAVSVRNSTRTDLHEVPVRVTVADTPDVARDALSVTAEDGSPLPHEVETWNPGAASVLWVNVPLLPKHGASTVWLYAGGEPLPNDPRDVWAERYSLVEHFAGDTASGGTRTDSTGQHTGTLVGADLTASGGATRFDGSRLEYPGDVGGDADRISISSVVRLTEDDVAALSDDGAIVAKNDATDAGHDAFRQIVRAEDGRAATRLAGNSFEFGEIDLDTTTDVPLDGEPHLLTQVYDGMTYSVFVDGEEVHSEMIEYRTTFSDPDVLTTIGGDHTGDDTLAGSFTGTLEEVQIAGVAFSPDFERFRHENRTGAALDAGPWETQGGDALALQVATPWAGEEVEAGLVTVTGTVGERATITATVDGRDALTEQVPAGPFTLRVPVDALGEADLTLVATGASGASVPVGRTLAVVDTVAPEAPELTDDSDTASAGDPVTLTASPVTGDSVHERGDVEFRVAEAIEVTAENTTMRAGTTTERTPAGLTPNSGEPAEALFGDTVGTDANPFQIYEVTLTPEQAAQEEYHLAWEGTAGERRVSAWSWDAEEQAWVLRTSGSDDEGGPVRLDVRVPASEGVVEDGVLRVLIWRGLTQEPTAIEDLTQPPAREDFDFGIDHIGDTQLYAQATPELMVDQFEYVREVAEERKTAIALHAGDWVNRPYLSQEYQWEGTERAAAVFEAAGLPLMIAWGNHDYGAAHERNRNLMMPTYWAPSRFEDSLEGTPFTYGGDQGIDNSYWTAELGGADLLFLNLGFYSVDTAERPGLAWAEEVIEAHPDHTIILTTHNVVGWGQNSWSNDLVRDRLVMPYPNVKLVLGGHIAGTGVAAVEREDGSLAHGVLTDYQSRVYGGQEYFKHIAVDAENGLMHLTTYSPMLDTRTSDGLHRQDIDPAQVPDFIGSDSENFVLEIDLDASTERVLSTGGLTLAGASARVGDVQTTHGAEPVQAVLDDLEPGVAYTWYAEIRDRADHVTRGVARTFTLGE